MERRNFLGSVIGSVFTLPFFARLETEEWQRVVLPYRMLFRDSISGFTIQAPGIAQLLKIPRTDKKDTAHEFAAEPLLAKQTMRLDSVILLTEQGRVIKESTFSQHVNMMRGDTLSITQSILIPKQLDSAPIEEIIDRILNNEMFWIGPTLH